LYNNILPLIFKEDFQLISAQPYLLFLLHCIGFSSFKIYRSSPTNLANFILTEDNKIKQNYYMTSRYIRNNISQPLKKILAYHLPIITVI